MKGFVVLSLFLLMTGMLIQVEGRKRKPTGRSTVPPKMGWRYGNGPCMCKGMMAQSTPRWPARYPTGPQPSGHRAHPTGHYPTRHYPSGPHSPPRHHHPTRRPHNHPTRRPHNHPTRRPHNHPTRRPHNHPTRRPHNHPTRRHSGPNRRQRGPRGQSRPTRKQAMKGHYTRCICRKPAENIAKIKFKMMKDWKPNMADRGSRTYKRLVDALTHRLAKVLRTASQSIHNMRFTKGSIVVQFEVKGSKDPEGALRHAIHSGQLSDLKIKPESLAVSQSYSGVKLTEWTTEEAMCRKCGSVQQERKCTEVTASCDGIQLTRNASCQEACPRSYITNCGGYRGFRMAKVLVIACFIVVGMIVLVAVLVITKVKRARRKDLSTSPSIDSLKQLTDDDKLQNASKC